MDNLAISVQNLSKAYRLYNNPVDRLKESIHPFKKKYHTDFFALKNVNFELQKGETLGIIGKNGSGKSTLLKIITGIITPSVGEISVNGKVSALLELGTGFNFEFTGIENIYMNGTIMGYSKEEIDAKLDEIIAFADIGDYIHQPVKTYSSGMFARLAFAVSSNVDPDILIVDEALSVGDVFFQAKCITRMRNMMEQGTTVLFVSHDTNTLKSFCRKALWLEHGEVVMYGDAVEVTNEYEKSLTETINANNSSKKSEEIITDGCNGKITAAEGANPISSSDSNNYDDSKYYRRGTGAVKIKGIEILTADGKPLNNAASFNQEIMIRMFVEVFEDCENLCAVYRIRNTRGIGILGNDTSSSLGNEFYSRKWKAGEKLQVDFITRLPLEHGNYNFAFVVSSYSDTENFQDVVFLDWIENAYVFEMKIKKPIPVWQAVYIDNQVNYHVF